SHVHPAPRLEPGRPQARRARRGGGADRGHGDRLRDAGPSTPGGAARPMRAELIGVGTEILLGQICNENAQWMSQRLAEIGVDVLYHQAVGDNVERIAEAFGLALSRVDTVLATGGLGPTQDDITREGLAAALRVRLDRTKEIEDF